MPPGPGIPGSRLTISAGSADSFQVNLSSPTPGAKPAAAVDPYTHFRKNLLSIERVRALSVLRPSRALADIAGCWACILAAWTMVAVFPSWWSVALAIPVVGARFYALTIIGHDGLHRRLYPDVERNDLVSDLFIYGAVGAITRLNNKNHLLHHHLLATEGDPDRHRHGCFNKWNVKELFGYLTGVTSVLRSIHNVLFPSAGPAPAKSGPGAERYTARDALILGGWQIALIGGLTTSIGWWAYPVLWIMPVYLFTFLADHWRSFAEHSHPEPDPVADRHRLITFESNRLERFFLAPMNMNFHAVHHLWMSIPYYNLPEADAEVRTMPAAKDLEWRGSYCAYLLRYLRALPLLDCRQTARAPQEAA